MELCPRHTYTYLACLGILALLPVCSTESAGLKRLIEVSGFSAGRGGDSNMLKLYRDHTLTESLAALKAERKGDPALDETWQVAARLYKDRESELSRRFPKKFDGYKNTQVALMVLADDEWYPAFLSATRDASSWDNFRYKGLCYLALRGMERLSVQTDQHPGNVPEEVYAITSKKMNVARGDSLHLDSTAFGVLKKETARRYITDEGTVYMFRARSMRACVVDLRDHSYTEGLHMLSPLCSYTVTAVQDGGKIKEVTLEGTLRDEL